MLGPLQAPPHPHANTTCKPQESPCPETAPFIFSYTRTDMRSPEVPPLAGQVRWQELDTCGALEPYDRTATAECMSGP